MQNGRTELGAERVVVWEGREGRVYPFVSCVGRPPLTIGRHA